MKTEKKPKLAPFISKLYLILSELDNIPWISWSESGDTFIVHHQNEFESKVLAKYFKHSNYCSFIRQVNTYGFTKIKNDDPRLWEWKNEYFQKDRPDLLVKISRRTSVKRGAPTNAEETTTTHVDYHPHFEQPSVSAVLSHESTNTSTQQEDNTGSVKMEVDSLKRDKDLLLDEVRKLKLQQQSNEQLVHYFFDELQHTKKKQKSIQERENKLLNIVERLVDPMQDINVTKNEILPQFQQVKQSVEMTPPSPAKPYLSLTNPFELKLEQHISNGKSPMQTSQISHNSNPAVIDWSSSPSSEMGTPPVWNPEQDNYFEDLMYVSENTDSSFLPSMLRLDSPSLNFGEGFLNDLLHDDYIKPESNSNNVEQNGDYMNSFIKTEPGSEGIELEQTTDFLPSPSFFLNSPSLGGDDFSLYVDEPVTQTNGSVEALADKLKQMSTHRFLKVETQK